MRWILYLEQSTNWLWLSILSIVPFAYLELHTLSSQVMSHVAHPPHGAAARYAAYLPGWPSGSAVATRRPFGVPASPPPSACALAVRAGLRGHVFQFPPAREQPAQRCTCCRTPFSVSLWPTSSSVHVVHTADGTWVVMQRRRGGGRGRGEDGQSYPRFHPWALLGCTGRRPSGREGWPRAGRGGRAPESHRVHAACAPRMCVALVVTRAVAASLRALPRRPAAKKSAAWASKPLLRSHAALPVGRSHTLALPSGR